MTKKLRLSRNATPWTALGATLFASGCPLLRAPLVLAEPHSLSLPYVAALLAGALAAALACVFRSDLFSAGAVSSDHADAQPPRPRWLWGVWVAYALGTALGIGTLWGLGREIALVGGFLAGCASVLLLARFMGMLAQPSLRINLLLSAAIFGIALAILWLAASMSARTGAQIALAVLSVAGGAVGALCPTSGQSQTTDARPSARPSQTALLSLLWLFIFGFFIKSGFGSGETRPLLFGLDKELALFAAAAVILAATCLLVRSAPLYTVVNQLVIPLLIVVVLVAQSFPAASPVHETGVALVVFTTAGAALFSIAVLATMGGAQETSPWRATGFLALAYVAGRLCGLVFDCAIPTVSAASVLYNPAMTLLLSIMLVIIIVSAWHGSVAPSTNPGGSAAALIKASCLEIASTYGLTPRETETLVLLARGYTSTVIANELVISENTVRTHMKNLYRKIGVSSRDEVFAKVDGWSSSAHATSCQSVSHAKQP